jgi:hypothetical protein
VGLVGCRSCEEEAPAVQAVADSAVEEIAPPFSDRVAYDCDLEPNPMNGPCESHAPGDDLIALSDSFTMVTAGHMPPSSEFWGPPTRALEQAESIDPASLVPAERIALQNAALHLERVSLRDLPALSRRAAALVKRLAMAPQPIATDLEPWLGPRSDWTFRASSIVPNVHEQFHKETRALRIVRTKTLRANFSKLVAIDPSGKPYVSDVIGSIEIRRGLGLDASACVVVVDPARLRCGKLAGLRAIRSPRDLPRTPFLDHTPDAVKCGSCHMELDKAAGLPITDGFDTSHDGIVLGELRRER